MGGRFQGFGTKMDSRFQELSTKIDEKSEETQRHMGVLVEEMEHKLDIVIEALMPVKERVDDHETRLGVVEEDVGTLKLAVRIGR